MVLSISRYICFFVLGFRRQNQSDFLIGLPVEIFSEVCILLSAAILNLFRSPLSPRDQNLMNMNINQLRLTYLSILLNIIFTSIGGLFKLYLPWFVYNYYYYYFISHGISQLVFVQAFKDYFVKCIFIRLFFSFVFYFLTSIALKILLQHSRRILIYGNLVFRLTVYGSYVVYFKNQDLNSGLRSGMLPFALLRRITMLGLISMEP